MKSEDDFQYAVENTRVLVAPDRRIETFGSTQFRFHLVTELLDRVNVIRVRDGRIEAEQPRIVSPAQYSKLLLEGFGDQARRYADWLEKRPEKLAFLKYGFQFRKMDMVEEIVHGSVEEVVTRIRGGMKQADEPLTAIIEGVDDAWEVCLLKFTVDLVQQSAGGNMRDFRRKGLL
ncbi:MAG: hypothetical protein PHQ12_08935 [Chthoniobacteraceae bacterium]|nr:hypothetical protein [Chthoniobacteraceae bacterium]